MMANAVLALHTLVFASFSATSLASPFVAYFSPETLARLPVIIGAAIFAAVVAVTWRLAGGCPLTIWENKRRLAEGKEPYAGGCIDRYARIWFGIALPANLSSRILYALLALPALSAGISWLVQ